MTAAGYCQDSTALDGINELLTVLSRGEMQSLCNSLGLGKRVSAADKEGLRLLLRQHAHGQQTLAGRKSLRHVIETGRQVIGACWRLEPRKRRIFNMAEVVFFQKTAWKERTLATVLLSEKQRDRYPRTRVSAARPLFPSRQHLQDYVEALEREYDMETALMRDQREMVMRWDQWAAAGMQQRTGWDEKAFAQSWQAELSQTQDMTVTAANQGSTSKTDEVKPVVLRYGLPWAPYSDAERQRHADLYLRKFSAPWVYVRMLTMGLEVLNKQHDYEQAAQRSAQLLAQDAYGTDLRGRWYEDLALHFQQHLDQPDRALAVCSKALSDPFVRTGHKVGQAFAMGSRKCRLN